MISLLADENFNNKILRGILRRNPDLDIQRIQDIPGLLGAEDAVILDLAAQDNRILLTHDVRTLAQFAFERVESGQRMPGVIEVSRSISIG